ncbi:MAG: ATP-binding protein [Pseudomonadota bacterium]
MRHLTLSSRVMIWIVLAHTVVVVVAGTLILLNARDAVKLEVLSAQESAVTLVRSTMASADGDTALQSLAAQVAQPRHVRMRVLHPTQGTLNLAEADMDDLEDDPAPNWFARWVTPEVLPARIEVDFDGTSGVIEVTAAPDDEAAEVWEDVRDLFSIWIAATVLLLVLLTFVVRQSLSPLKTFEHVLNALHSGDLTARVGDLPSRDLQPLGHQIDALAESLEDALQDRRLTDARLLRLRDSERKEIARELHDELGPCLFAITVEADALTGDYSGRGARIKEAVDRIRALNSRVLDAVRPVTIGALPLVDIVSDLIGSFEDQAPNVTFTLDFENHVGSTSESVDLTVYRVVQEALTNALRHGGPDNINVYIRSGTSKTHRTLEIRVFDDGCGIDPAWQSGNGLLGMQERVASLGGRLEVRPQSTPGHGTTLCAFLPMETS